MNIERQGVITHGSGIMVVKDVDAASLVSLRVYGDGIDPDTRVWGASGRMGPIVLTKLAVATVEGVFTFTDREHVYPQTEAEVEQALENAKSGQTIHLPTSFFPHRWTCNVDDIRIVGPTPPTSSWLYGWDGGMIRRKKV